MITKRAKWTREARAKYPLLGFPQDSMRRYFDEGLTPDQAVEKALLNRKIRPTKKESQ